MRLMLSPEDGEKPSTPGLYVAYINGPAVRFAEKKLLNFTADVGWMHPLSDQRFRAAVYGWVGPLPALELED